MNRIAAFLIVALVAGATGFWFGKKKGSVVEHRAIEQLHAKAPIDANSSRLDSLVVDTIERDGTINLDTTVLLPTKDINTKGVKPSEVVLFAKTLMGVPYLYGSTNPNAGFDCSGFITYVFNHFGISVPRSSFEFTSVGQEVATNVAKPGDLILFTGTNPLERTVGHMGIVIDNSDSLRFIHSSSGKANGVTITSLTSSYLKRYVKTIRIFPQNGKGNN